MKAPNIAIWGNIAQSEPHLHLQKNRKDPQQPRRWSNKDNFQSRLARYKPLLSNNASI